MAVGSIHYGGNPALQHTKEGGVADILLFRNIRERAIDQLDDQMALVGVGMDRFGIIPVRLLGGGRLAFTKRAVEAFRAIRM